MQSSAERNLTRSRIKGVRSCRSVQENANSVSCYACLDLSVCVWSSAPSRHLVARESSRSLSLVELLYSSRYALVAGVQFQMRRCAVNEPVEMELSTAPPSLLQCMKREVLLHVCRFRNMARGRSLSFGGSMVLTKEQADDIEAETAVEESAPPARRSLVKVESMVCRRKSMSCSYMVLVRQCSLLFWFVRRDESCTGVEGTKARVDSPTKLYGTINPQYTYERACELYGGAPRPLSGTNPDKYFAWHTSGKAVAYASAMQGGTFSSARRSWQTQKTGAAMLWSEMLAAQLQGWISSILTIANTWKNPQTGKCRTLDRRVFPGLFLTDKRL